MDNVKQRILKRIKDNQQGPGALTLDEQQKLVDVPEKGIFGQIGDEIKLMKAPVAPEDESVYRPTLKNKIIEKLGLPDKWRSSLADEKRYVQDAPQMIGGATMGSINKVGGGLLKGAAAQEAKAAEKLFELGHTRPGAGLEGKPVFGQGPVGKVLDPKMQDLAGKNMRVLPEVNKPVQTSFKQDLSPDKVKEIFERKFGARRDAIKQDVIKKLRQPKELDSFKQEMFDLIRKGHITE